MPLHKCLQKKNPKILLLGSGALSIGQAGEFDYSGSQALKAFEEEGIEVVLINPNIATVQTNPKKHVKVYLYPLELEWITKVIEVERPDALVAGFGGQTGLNCAIELDKAGILKKYNMTNLGTAIQTLEATEDRDLFSQKLKEIDIPTPPGHAVETIEEGKERAREIGYPLIIRAAYALGGLGSGFVDNEEELITHLSKTFSASSQALLDKSLRGWKEIEYEVMRDSDGNIITICNMENFDPLGVHTGDSIVIAPSQTLTDDEYQILRNSALRIVSSLEVVGECNVQFALDPQSHDYYVIEVNARLSRSSALASKASGYPIAYLAAKVVLGYGLLELKNPVTTTTAALFEPSFDYVTLKIPRWDLQKFSNVSRQLGSTMKSVGEIMSIGRNFQEVLQKALRMVFENGVGLTKRNFVEFSDRELLGFLETPTDTRMFAVFEALERGISIEQLHETTFIDKWFLSEIKEIVGIEKDIMTCFKNASGEQVEEIVKKGLESLSEVHLRRWKRHGFSDEQIALYALESHDETVSTKRRQELSLVVREMRKQKGIRPSVKKIDTTAGEHSTPSNYLYTSYDGRVDDVVAYTKNPCVVVLGGGAYRIGSSVEFDWCAVTCGQTLQEQNYKTVMVNCNPETVSTDYNISDRLYFEELTLERILDIVDQENPKGVIVCMGGQIPNSLSLPLAKAGVTLLGHSAESIDSAEDREQFSDLLKKLGIDQPQYLAAASIEEIESFVQDCGFPILVRPSYVLSGTAMKVASDSESLKKYLTNAINVSQDHPVVLTEYFSGAREVELDGVAAQGEICASILSEHCENAGVHSGDATLILPALSLDEKAQERVKQIGAQMAKGLKLNGPFNMQFLVKEDEIKVIECNARASRSFPFVSKVSSVNLAQLATKVCLGVDCKSVQVPKLKHVGVKAPKFSFNRLEGADPMLGVEMVSTGEVGCLGEDFHTAYLLAYHSIGVFKPQKGILLSTGMDYEKKRLLEIIPVFEKLKLKIYATRGTSKYLEQHGFKSEVLNWPGQSGTTVIDVIKEGIVDFVINIPKNFQGEEITRGSQIRKAAIQYGHPLITNVENALSFFKALEKHDQLLKQHKIRTLQSYH